MTKKRGAYIIGSILILIIGFYSIPVKKKSFSEYYQGDNGIQELLSNFRERPLQSLRYQNKAWHYVSLGKGKKTLLFLHGMGGAYDIWFQQINELKTDFKIISLTLPTVHSLEEAANGIIQVLNEEDIKKVCFIGTSMGGYIGQYFLDKHPDRLEKIVLGNTFPPNGFFIKQNGGMRKIVPFLPEWLVMDNFRKNASTNVIPSSENSKLVEAYLLEQYSGLMSKRQFIGRFDIVLEHFEMNNNSNVRYIPKLIIESDNDPLITKELRQLLKENFKEAEVFTFSEKGHFPYLNQPKNYTRVLFDFLSD
ncbi:MAG: alpha/beta hydrolase [Bacteroidota bacterium]